MSEIISLITEDILKIMLLSFLLPRVHITNSTHYIQKQYILSGILFGLGFGLSETYMYRFIHIQPFPMNFLLGSIPLQMIIGGSIGYSMSQKINRGKRTILLMGSMLGHLLYNTLLKLPLPFTYVPFIILIVLSILLIQSLFYTY